LRFTRARVPFLTVENRSGASALAALIAADAITTQRGTASQLLF
jgi:hypothetical protein